MGQAPYIALVCIAESGRFRLSSKSPPGNESSPLSQLVQTESPPTSPASTLFAATPVWQVAILAALSLWLSAPTIVPLLAQWWLDPNSPRDFLAQIFPALII